MKRIIWIGVVSILLLVISTQRMKAQDATTLDDLILQFGFDIDVYWTANSEIRIAIQSSPSNKVFILDDALRSRLKSG